MDFKISEDIQNQDSSDQFNHFELNILMVEDNSIDQKILTSFLSETDYCNSNIHIADTLEKAKGVIKNNNINLIMLDLYLPDSHGMESVSMLKNIGRNIPIIILSGMSDKNYAAKAINYGAQDFIVKGEYSANGLEKAIKYALERQQLISQRKQAEKEFQIEIEKERQRIAMDIHDGLGQMLIAIKYKLASIDITETDSLPLEIERIEELLVNTIDEARKISELITPRVMNEFGIKAAIEQMCNQLQSSTTTKIELEIDDNIPIFDANVLTNYYRITQESLNNAFKYAKAGTVWIRIKYEYNILSLEVNDDGIGFDMKNYEQGNGIKNIKRRTGFIDGEFYMESTPGAGTQIKIRAPYYNINK